MQKWEERIFLNQQLGMRVYFRIVMIIGLKMGAGSHHTTCTFYHVPEHRELPGDISVDAGLL